MGGTGNGVFVYAYLRGKEPGDKIVFPGARRTRNDDTAHGYCVEECKVGIDPAEGFFRIDFHDVVEAILPHVFEADPQRLGEIRRGGRSCLRLSGEIHFHPAVIAFEQ